MADMKFKFTIQPYQTEAVESVTGVFAGQSFASPLSYRRDVPQAAQASLFDGEADDDFAMGFANALVELGVGQMLTNINRVQSRNNIHLSQSVVTGGLGRCSLDVEMETGTGKTYVYIKTMFELNKQYGWTKFIVVVPSIAIREGVKKSFAVMQEHFMEHYGKKVRFFVYDSKNLAEIDHFTQSADLYVMIINTQAFNARGKDARRIRIELDDFGSRRPIDVIRKCRPILILDEPQKMGGNATQASLKEFDPLFCLNYSATHKEHHALVYVLDALDAYRKRLVKQIEVKGFDLKNLSGMNRYLFLEGIVISGDRPPTARLEFEIGHSKSIKRETRLVTVGDDLFALSKEMEQYRGYRVSQIDPLQRTLSFTNGGEIRVGEVQGDVSEETLRRVQIRETIRSHFEKEKELFGRGIKCLSLFFIDKVEKYRKYDESGSEVNSEYGRVFEEEYTAILNEYLTLFSTPYEEYLKGIETAATHTGYFSIDKKGRKVDSSLRRGSDESDDISAYDLIMKDKERLLSFENPVRFIFSHSALREGWDNPNVFQICTLKHGGSSAAQKRQEVGRGLRLCVNRHGDRQDERILGSQVQQVNQLTVIAADGYREFVADLQKGIREDLCDRPTEVTAEYFIGKTLFLGGEDATGGEMGAEVTVSEKQGRAIYKYLVRNEYVDDDDHITDKYRTEREENSLAPLPESIAALGEAVHALVAGIFDPHALDGMIRDGNETKVADNPLNDNFYKAEFKKLWSLIQHKYAYTVDFDGEELARKAIAHIDAKMFVTRLQYTVTSGRQGSDFTAAKLKSGDGFVAERSRTYTLGGGEGSAVKYDVIGKIAEGAKLTRRTAARIVAGLRPTVFAMLQNNPEEFIAKAIRLINEQKAAMIVEEITYNRTEGVYDSAIFTAEKNSDFSRAYRAKRNVQDYLFADGYAKDGKSVERRMAERMDTADEVCVYAKLPKGFHIPTPVGNYSPDWAIAFNKDMVKHIFFIAETKGTMESLKLKPIEQAKIKCAKKLFAGLSDEDVVYHEVDSYQSLLDIMEKL
ncbi:DEAD/DEAH box helicase family protein [Selenomonas sp. TAMA-11512]|uniref:type III restriction-modification system endonuclease n=1 Tax=Selenomonas sp. TAMA-11512 TaxID=3095337 RepID=UPI00308F7F3E|nr:DEAD/DEAH box helicase family protein [Selenomonas sp. TAMA-11512]